MPETLQISAESTQVEDKELQHEESATSFFVHVSYISEDVDKKALIDRFAAHGSIRNSERILCEKLDLGFCVVEYQDLNSANLAVESENSSVFENRKLKVCLKPADQSTTMTKDPKIVVLNLPQKLNKEEQKELLKRFSEFGEVLNSNWILKKFVAKDRCCSICYASSDECFNAIRNMNGKLLFGQVISVKFDQQLRRPAATPPGRKRNSKASKQTARPVFRSGDPNRSIMVTKLARFWKPDEVLSRFSMHGEITRSSATEERSKDGRGFLHIEYRSKRQAQRAVDAENGALFSGKEIMVEMSDNGGKDDSTLATDFSSKEPELIPNRMETNVVKILCDETTEMIRFGQYIKEELEASQIPGVEVLLHTPGYSFHEMFDKFSSVGVKFVCLFASRNIPRRTVSVRCLSGGQTLADVPVAEAVAFIRKKYLKLRADAFVVPPNIRTIAGFLAEGRDISVAEFDTFLRFMVSYRQDRLKEAYGSRIPTQLLQPPLQSDKDPVLNEKEGDIQAALLDVLDNLQAPPAPSVRQARVQQARVKHTLAGFLKNQPPASTSMHQQIPENHRPGFRSAFNKDSEYQSASHQGSEYQSTSQQSSMYRSVSQQGSEYPSASHQGSEYQSAYQQGSEFWGAPQHGSEFW